MIAAFFQRGRRERSKLIESLEDLRNEITKWENTDWRTPFEDGYLAGLRWYEQQLKGKP